MAEQGWQMEFANIKERLEKFDGLSIHAKAFVVFAVQHALECELFRKEYGTYGVEQLKQLAE